MNVTVRNNKRQQELEESLLSRLLNAVEIFLEEEDRLLKEKEDGNSKFRDLINYFLNQKKELDISSRNYSTLMHFVVKHGDNESFKSLLSNSNFDVNVLSTKGVALMHVVATIGTGEMMQALLDRSADINVRNIIKGSEETMKFNSGEIEGYVPLHCAAYAGNVEILEMLLDQGADVNANSYYGTPLHFACGAINDIGNDYLIKKRNNWSSDKVVSNIKRANAVKILLERGASIERKDSTGKTPLQRACSNGNLKVMEVLLNHLAPI